MWKIIWPFSGRLCLEMAIFFDIRYQISDFRNWILDIGYRIWISDLDIGYWISDFGIWISDLGTTLSFLKGVLWKKGSVL